MSTPVMIVTNAGMAALVAASGTDQITITQVGLSGSSFSNSPTRTSLPGEFSRVPVVSGVAADQNTLHLVMTDAGDDDYDVRSFGLYLDDGTLFAFYSQSSILFSKAASTTFVLQTDVRFAGGEAGSINFGDATFVNPPATTVTPGVVELATIAEAKAGTDTVRAVTPAGLDATLDERLGAYIPIAERAAPGGVATLDGDSKVPVAQLPSATTGAAGVVEFATLTETAAGESTDRSVTPRGLAVMLEGYLPFALRSAPDGVASLDDDSKVPAAELPNATTAARGIVELATEAEAVAGTDTARAVTPKGLAAKLAALIGIDAQLAQNGYLTIFGLTIQWGRFVAVSDGFTSVPFPKEFASACFSVVVSGTFGGAANSQDNAPAVVVNTINSSSFKVFSADETADACCYIAVGA